MFQHIPVEHPGIFRDFMQSDGVTWDTVELDEGDSIPDLAGYDALIVMGGPMDVWEEDKHPWLVPEKQAIREAIIDRQMPFLGFCLGHQLMAEALGGMVGPMDKPEVGILDVHLTPDDENTSLFSGLPKNIKTLQWHGASVLEVPPESRILAESPACAIQALQFGDAAFSMQFHIELIDSTVTDWGKVPEYEQSLEKTLGAGSIEKLDREAKKHIENFNVSAQIIYKNFMLTAHRYSQ